jgi:hypothetical protein
MANNTDPVVTLIVFAVMAVFYVVTLVWGKHGGRAKARLRAHKRLKAFLIGARQALRDPSGEELLGLSFAAALRSGRRARIWFSGSGRAMTVRLCVSTAREVPSLRVRLERMVGRGVKEDLQTGDRAFDDQFFLQSTDPREGGRVLQGDLRRAITLAFARKGVQRLVLKPGELTLEADVRTLEPDKWGPLLESLDRAATLVETKRMQVRVLGGERDVVCDPEGKTRCAFCRDGITGDEEDLVACDRCRTVLHGACWTEHGSCPMLGCEGDAPERARVGYGEPA